MAFVGGVGTPNVLRKCFICPASRPLRDLSRAKPGVLRMAMSGAEVTASSNEVESVSIVTDAVSISGFLAIFWRTVCEMIDGQHASATKVVLTATKCTPLQDNSMLARLLEHFQSCRDLCNEFGESIQLSVNVKQEEGSSVPVFQLAKNRGYKLFADDGEDDWDDWGEIDTSLLDKYAEIDKETVSTVDLPEPVPQDDEEILKRTIEWVQAIVVDLGICPFTSSSAERAGLPIGNVRYCLSRKNSTEEMYREYWQELTLLLNSSESDISTTLLITPEFHLDNSDGFDEFCNSLMSTMAPLAVEKDIQLVFFHPKYSFRDGAMRTDENGAANYARRSPWPMINILRTNQVRAAQRVIPTGLVYKQNEETLNDIGAVSLESMLLKRNWDDVAEYSPVDRRTKNPVREAADALRKQQGESF